MLIPTISPMPVFNIVPRSDPKAKNAVQGGATVYKGGPLKLLADGKKAGNFLNDPLLWYGKPGKVYRSNRDAFRQQPSSSNLKNANPKSVEAPLILSRYQVTRDAVDAFSKKYNVQPASKETPVPVANDSVQTSEV